MDAEGIRQLRARWAAHVRPFGVDAPRAGETFDDIASRYRTPDRYYHNLDHVEDVLWHCFGDRERPPDPPSPLAFAAWLHDVIYDSRARDNEERSAEYASDVLTSLGAPASIREETARLILLTKSHETTTDDLTGQQLLDADLAILGANPEDYDAYAAAIRREYAWVNEADYRAGRMQVLERFLARKRLYHTDRMFRAFEPPARANLTRERDALKNSFLPGLPKAPGTGEGQEGASREK